MRIENIYLKNKMKIGVIGISGKGKSTLLNHLINEEVALSLSDLIGTTKKESETSGQTKNPVRYFIQVDMEDEYCKVKFIKDGKCEELDIEFTQVAEYATSHNKCTVDIHTTPSEEFKVIMENFNLTELEFIDTQGLLDTLDEEVTVPYEIKECAILLYLYDNTDQGVRGDYIKKYRSFLNDISNKPLIFLETSIQCQLKSRQFNESLTRIEAILEELDSDFPVEPETIQERYTILTGNSEYKNSDTFILSSVLSAAESSVNFYVVKLPKDKEDYFNDCLRICAAHTMDGVFERLSGFKDLLQSEFQKAKSDLDYRAAFSTCYDLLHDVFISKWQRIDCYTYSKVLRSARRDNNRFIHALIALNSGDLFTADYGKSEHEFYNQFGYYRIFETFDNQDILDCMQLLLDMYMAYLKKIKIETNDSKLSKALRVYLERSVSSDFLCRDTMYDIPVLSESVFRDSLHQLKDWIGKHPVENVEFSNFAKLDISHSEKKKVLRYCNTHIANPNSLITKLVYLCECINSNIYDIATNAILGKTGEFLDNLQE